MMFAPTALHRLPVEKALSQCIDINTPMSARTVTLAEDAYAALAAQKREGESFSMVVRRLTKSDRSVREFAGAWKDVPDRTMREFDRWMAWSDRESRTEMMRPFGRTRR
ncbi:MAG: antitoxin VapB family protein [Thermoplasmata archaeon]|nr:antitoxin VapB family protein [Thermoplasmata archaeon]